MYIMKSNKIGFIASNTKEAQEALLVLSKKYDNFSPDKADLIVALGGDGSDEVFCGYKSDSIDGFMRKSKFLDDQYLSGSNESWRSFEESNLEGLSIVSSSVSNKYSCFAVSGLSLKDCIL